LDKGVVAELTTQTQVLDIEQTDDDLFPIYSTFHGAFRALKSSTYLTLFLEAYSLEDVAQLDERANGVAVRTLESFSLTHADSSASNPADRTAPFDRTKLSSGVAPAGVSFNSGEVSGLSNGPWLVSVGLKYSSSDANASPRAKILTDNLDQIGWLKPNFTLASVPVFANQVFMTNLKTDSKLKVIYGDSGPANSSFVVRLILSKLSQEAATVLNPSGQLTIGGINVDINGQPIII
jgi:hypothetical protein